MKNKLKTLVLTKYADLGASSRVRFLQYIPYLEENNFQFSIFPLLSNEYIKNLYAGKKKSIIYICKAYIKRFLILLKLKSYDLVWLENEFFPYVPFFIEKLFIRKMTPCLVGYDDPVFHNYDENSNRHIRKIFGDKIDKIMKSSAGVIAGNNYIMNRAKKSGAKKCVLLPSVVDTKKLHVLKKGEKFNSFVIGWIGTPSTIHFVYDIKESIKKFSKNKDVILLLIGVEGIKIAGVDVLCKQWGLNSESELLNMIDVGIMPLDSSFWAKGKCGYKLIQYMACEKPVIASAVGANKKIVDHKVNGFLVDSESDWINAFNQLYNSEKLRKTMGIRGKNKVEKEYSIKATLGKLIKTINETAGLCGE